jgi:hypothetical protein
MKASTLKNCKQQLENAFYLFIGSNGKNDKTAVYTYLNDVQDSIIKDLHPSIKDSEKERITSSLENHNLRLRKKI